MASPFSGLVLGASAALTSPTLYAAFVVGSMPLEDALVRFVTTVAIATVAITLVQWLFHGTSPLTDAQREAAVRLSELGAKGRAADDVRVTEAPGAGND